MKPREINLNRRTTEQRLAYIEGYVNAVIDVRQSGINKATDFARDILLVEEELGTQINKGTINQAKANGILK